jgi:hypothetical protein
MGISPCSIRGRQEGAKPMKENIMAAIVAAVQAYMQKELEGGSNEQREKSNAQKSS